ncbi:MAG: OsmC family protein [Oligoflexia bacterium]|nr:OsmC family protein [Oligoflexia bacterium]
MEIKIRFPGNKKVSAEFDGYTVLTDQPKSEGGDGSAPAPFDLFLASIGTCAGYVVSAFCEKRGIPTKEIELVQKMEWDETKHLFSKISIEILLPKDFPEKYRSSLISAANLCSVKKHILNPPQFEIETKSRPE